MIAWLVFAFPARAADRGTEALETWLAGQQDLQTWSAEFVQVRRMRTLREPLEARGRVWFGAPNLFRWELGDPVRTLAIRGRSEMAILYPRLERAEIYGLDAIEQGPLGHALSLLEAGFPRTRAQIEERFVIRGMEPVEEGRWRMELQPRSTAARKLVTSVLIEFIEDAKGPAATELRFADGSAMRNEFEHAAVNPELEEGWFDPRVPDHYKVSRPHGGASTAGGRN